jgi:hypothetical protein
MKSWALRTRNGNETWRVKAKVEAEVMSLQVQRHPTLTMPRMLLKDSKMKRMMTAMLALRTVALR